jgi:transcriptional regulator with XRE-family HTH domain
MEQNKQQSGQCAFGAALVEQRTKQGLSQSRLSILAEVNVTNLRKIEKGTMQPGVTIALRLVSATGADVGDFFQNLAIINGLLPLPDASGSGRKVEAKNQSLKGIVHLPKEKLYAAKSVFGITYDIFRTLKKWK